VAELYRRRWQIELFFKWIRQTLKVKAFYGTSWNAVLIQIWTALIAYLLLVWLKPCCWNVVTFGPGCAHRRLTIVNLYYSTSVSDSSVTLLYNMVLI